MSDEVNRLEDDRPLLPNRDLPEQDPTGRFQTRAAAYRAGRPGYPDALFEWIWSWLEPAAVVCDLGSGTGILTRSFLERGHRVFAVEPNEGMRHAAESELGAASGLIHVAGRAEATGLTERSVDLITAAQAFHWFELEATRREAQRILREQGRMLVLWNDRVTAGNRFLEDYEAFLRRWGGEGYGKVARTWNVREQLEGFFGPGELEHRAFDNVQVLDLEGMRARLLSSSYIPGEGHPDHQAMLAAVPDLFARHQQDGVVAVRYQVNAYLGGW